MRAISEGVTWVDGTVTGMGCVQSNARTEELAIELAEQRGQQVNLVPSTVLLHECSASMQNHYNWGTNPYYYLVA